MTLVPNGLPNAYIDVPPDKECLLSNPRAGSIRIAVTDSGAGLSTEQLAQICSEGVQFNANQLQAGGGSGLGLYISKGLAEQHGGSLTVTSDGLGLGSTFTLELPLFKSDIGLSTISTSTRSVATDRPNSNSISDVESGGQPSPRTARKQRILVVDDAASNRKFLMRILQNKGFVCHDAEDGQRGVDAFLRLRAEGVQLDAIVMDFEMPVMNGPIATKVLRDLGCGCFIAGVTGNVLPADIEHFKAQGADTVLAKPLNLDLFEAAWGQYRFSSERLSDEGKRLEDDNKEEEQTEMSEVDIKKNLGVFQPSTSQRNNNNSNSTPLSHHFNIDINIDMNMDRMESGGLLQGAITVGQDSEPPKVV